MNEKAAQIVAGLIKKGMKIAIAESLTGGALSATIVSVPGASYVLDEAMTTYSNDAKIARLGVSPQTIENLGAVSAQCAEEMAEGIAKTSGADYGIATTGIAGPDGATPQKPVGLVYIGAHHKNKTVSYRYVFEGDRNAVIAQTVNKCLDILQGEFKEEHNE
ncbi:MAG: CinA family protein [Defluviitaleaceae bacterium]|nr:CinA family protein [Defluviitaleaceae bacterium]